MAPRLSLQVLLEALLGSENVYFQPPADRQMAYPCLVYTLDDMKTEYADNNPYLLSKRYRVTVIDRNPDSPIPDKLAGLPMCRFVSKFVTNNLNHTVFNLYF